MKVEYCKISTQINLFRHHKKQANIQISQVLKPFSLWFPWSNWQSIFSICHGHNYSNRPSMMSPVVMGENNVTYDLHILSKMCHNHTTNHNDEFHISQVHIPLSRDVILLITSLYPIVPWCDCTYQKFISDCPVMWFYKISSWPRST